MVEAITEQSFFHINSTANLSPHDLMRRGLFIEVGNQTNPFFRFYETYQRTYAVTDTNTSVVHQVPAIKFLRCIKDGTVTSNMLPTIAVETAKHFLMLARELVWENVRLAEFPDAPSRQRCIWLIRTLEDTKRWISQMGFQPNCYWVVQVRGTGRILDVDANLLAGDSEPLPTWYEKARAYWMGKKSENPLPEVLFEGTIRVEEIVNMST